MAVLSGFVRFMMHEDEDCCMIYRAEMLCDVGVLPRSWQSRSWQWILWCFTVRLSHDLVLEALCCYRQRVPHNITGVLPTPLQSFVFALHVAGTVSQARLSDNRQPESA